MCVCVKDLIPLAECTISMNSIIYGCQYSVVRISAIYSSKSNRHWMLRHRRVFHLQESHVSFRAQLQFP